MPANRVAPIDEPREFLPHELFFSLTDEKGRIRCGNSVFTRIAAYTEAELVGSAHNIIRHPDMPRCVFQVLWDYLLAGRSIAAYVKNLAKDGRYYWVLAVVTPCREGFLSVRLKPSTGLFDAARQIYRETLAAERRVEAQSGVKAAIEQSTPLLLEKLADAGFEDYDAFMRHALADELVARERLVGTASPSHRSMAGPAPGCLESLRDSSQRVVEQLATVFASLDLFHRLNERLAEKHRSLEELGPSLSFLALNANLSASRLGGAGATLSVIARDLGARSKEADALLTTLMQRIAPLRDAARKIAFDVAVAQLESRVCEAFSHEILAGDAGDSTCVDEGLEPLSEEMVARCGGVLADLRDLVADVDVLHDAATQLVQRIGRMKIVHVNGKIEVAGLPGAESFESIFDDVTRLVASANDDCSAVIDLLSDTRDRVERLARSEADLRVELDGVSSAVDGVLGMRGVRELV